jgi:hypothetical protein
MAESGWATLEDTQEHLQNLVCQGYKMAMEIATCRVPKDPASPIQAGGWGGYIVACVTFNERGFGVPSHHLLCSLL